MKYYDISIDNKPILNVEEVKVTFSLLKGLVRHEDLFKMKLSSTTYKQLDIQKDDEKIRLEEIINFQDFQESQSPSKKEELITDTYLIYKIKPREIASRFRVSISKVY